MDGVVVLLSVVRGHSANALMSKNCATVLLMPTLMLLECDVQAPLLWQLHDGHVIDQHRGGATVPALTG